ncbi:MAG: tRNA (adenosine(37)-N6)-dimethylallyltransferase MiaA [Actinomycetota bacterium]
MSPNGRLAPLVIVGPTASGKSALALELARRLVEPCEIISADAMAVYRGMDVGTAKPSEAERAEVTHHLIDVVDPGEEYTVARFQADVAGVVAAIGDRGAVPIVVGGTGLYVRAVVDNFTMPGQYPEVRAVVEAEPSLERLWSYLQQVDPAAATKILPSNRRRIERALEVTLGAGRPFSSFGPGLDHYPPSSFRQVGLRLDRGELDRRIEARYQQQLDNGFLDEVDALAAGPLSRTAGQALGYREFLAHRAGELTFPQALELATKRTRRFARRQERWFRRDPRITWFDALDHDLADRVERWWRNPLVAEGDR